MFVRSLLFFLLLGLVSRGDVFSQETSSEVFKTVGNVQLQMNIYTPKLEAGEQRVRDLTKDGLHGGLRVLGNTRKRLERRQTGPGQAHDLIDDLRELLNELALKLGLEPRQRVPGAAHAGECRGGRGPPARHSEHPHPEPGTGCRKRNQFRKALDRISKKSEKTEMKTWH